jgi:23S rRNA pseudouridine2605 synthase
LTLQTCSLVRFSVEPDIIPCLRHSPPIPKRPANRNRGNESLPDGGRKTGLARALSKLGFCSRSRAGELIRAGRVRLNGVVRRNAETPADLRRDRIEVDGRAIEAAAKIYLVLNKARGVVTTASDQKGHETVYDSLRAAGGEDAKWLAPVGRLDKASEGLLLLTNDSEWAARVLAPETHLAKTYHVQIGALADERVLAALRKGLRSEGEFLGVRSADLLRRGERNSWLQIVLEEGKNRHIRRMLQELGIEVLRLVRVAIGPLALGDLAKGAARPLTQAEKTLLDDAMSKAGDVREDRRKSAKL